MTEIIIAISIATMALGTGMMFLYSSTVFVRTQVDERAAREIAFAEVERTRSAYAEALENCSSRKIIPSLPSVNGLRNATCLLDVSDCNDVPGIKTVSVTVKWKSWRRTREVTHTSLVRQRGSR